MSCNLRAIVGCGVWSVGCEVFAIVFSPSMSGAVFRMAE